MEMYLLPGSSFFNKSQKMLLKSKSYSNESPLLVDTFIANKQQIFLCWRPVNLTNMLMKTVEKKTCIGDFTRKDFQRTKGSKIISVIEKSFKPDLVIVEIFYFRRENHKHSLDMQIIQLRTLLLKFKTELHFPFPDCIHLFQETLFPRTKIISELQQCKKKSHLL